jgi:thioredoxin 1
MSKYKIIKYEAPWCSPCKALDSILEQVDIEIEHVDIGTTDGMERGQKHNVRSIPTMYLFDESDNEIKSHVGLMSLDELKEWIN